MSERWEKGQPGTAIIKHENSSDSHYCLLHVCRPVMRRNIPLDAAKRLPDIAVRRLSYLHQRAYPYPFLPALICIDLLLTEGQRLSCSSRV